MKCPSCATPLATPEPRCPECKLSLQRLDMKFGLVPRHSRYLSDRSHRLTLPEMKSLRHELRLFEKKFPQILFAVLLTELPTNHPVHEYAFWMANRARFSSLEKTRSDNYDLLLVIDTASDMAALVAGYGLEPYVSEDDLTEVLEALARPLRAGDWAGGIHACIQALISKLRECCANARQQESANVS